ncbi:hypothetical protein ACFUJU_31125 [Streptomyces sp. NPDC057235]|uniref:tetratricopeptide repeat protein n=1 Tax=Streptomyces sp. NPDC057235 TaxID=3346058 RepID=UPI0036273ADA
MDASDLEYRARTRSGCIPPELVSRLLEHGHTDVVALQAADGEWFCALAWARLLGERGRQNDALDVLTPYLATGWWTAVEAAAQMLEDWGRIDEAIDIIRVRMEAGHPMALESYTRLLARHSRAAEAFTLLCPHTADPSLAAALVDVAGAAGRDEEAAVLLAARTEHQCSDFPWCCRGLDPDTALGLLATIRERQDRADEAIALLHTSSTTRLDHREQLAALLARHNRLDELRTVAATDDSGCAVRQLARSLEEHGDVEGAVEAYRQAGRPGAYDSGSVVELAQLLARHGRGSEAIEVMRMQADISNGDDWVLRILADLCLAQNNPEDGLAHLDALAATRHGEERWDLYRIRLPLIAAHDGVDEAVTQARTHPESTTWYAASHIAELLADAGRVEEAVTVLEQHASTSSHELASYLIDLGRVQDALALLQLHTLERQRLS